MTDKEIERLQDKEIKLIAQQRFAMALIFELDGGIKKALKYCERAYQLNPTNDYKKQLDLMRERTKSKFSLINKDMRFGNQIQWNSTNN